MKMSPVPSRPLAIALVVSSMLHVALSLGMWGFALSTVETPMELLDPIDAQLGFDDEEVVPLPTEVEGVEAPAPEPEPQATAATDDPSDTTEGDAGVEADAALDDAAIDVDGAVDAEIADADLDAQGDADAATDAQIGVEDAGVPDAALDAALVALADAGPATPPGPSVLTGPSRLSRGQNISIRVDFAAVRTNFLGEPVRNLIGAIPEWSRLLDGSGVNPTEDFDQIFAVTPNPRELALVAVIGRHRHDVAWVRARTQAVAAAQGQTAEWTTVNGIERAPWHARDGNPRIVAILGPNHFAVCTQAALPVLLRHAETRRVREGLTGSAYQALMAMGEGEVVALEGANLTTIFSTPAGPVPETARVAISMEQGAVHVEALAGYPDAETAAEASRVWGAKVDTLANNIPLLGNFIRGVHLEPRASDVRIGAGMNEAQTRLLLGFIQGTLESRRRP